MNFVGVDIGALFLKAVKTDEAGRVVNSFYERHRGEPAEILTEAFDSLAVSSKDAIGFTGVNAELFAKKLKAPFQDVTICQIEAIRRLVPDASYIMDIGGGSTTLIQLDGKGKFQGYSTNSLCAAGTGSFLDEQAGRLGISYDDAKLFPHNPSPPTIATRCTVFAKSDLIHRQQEGCSRVDMWSGLCRGMTRTMLSTLLNGRPLDGKTVVIGGVALNTEVIRWLEVAYPDLIQVPETPNLIAARGAARLGKPLAKNPLLREEDRGEIRKDFPRFPWPLSLEKSTYPSFATEEGYVDAEKNEIRITHWPEGETVRGYLGVDIGSTSTKLVLMDDDEKVLADIYRKTAGDPIGATKLLFRALRALTERKGCQLEVLGVGTTGSGRKIAGSVIGADAIVNEISAHVAGAAKTDKTIDTIFEIGGQDSKYMHLVDGHIRDANMNYVCAAGTGSFVEEQAIKLGYNVADAGPAVLGLYPPRATDRCTVFMEQDTTKLVQAGATPEEAFAAVMVSVIKNYLNKVVGNRYRNRDKIFFQGATARNPALVAAFERLLGVEVVVSPYCHVMGSYGVALLTRELMKGKETSKFLGLDLDERKITLRKEECDLCDNDCDITYADIEGIEESPSWGYMCGREPGDKKMKATPNARYLRKRQRLWKEFGRGVEVPKTAPIIGIPQALTTYTYLPLWRRFFNRLGFQVQSSGDTTDAIREQGTRMSGADFCFPAKVFLGHVASLATQDGVDFVFVPQMKNQPKSEHVSASKFCPYVQATPAYARAALQLNGMEAVKMLSPIVDMRLTPERTAARLAKWLKKPLGKSSKKITEAWLEAFSVQNDFQERLIEEGRKAIAEAKKKGEKLLLLVGRPYNLYDGGLNLGLPDKLAEYGRTILPLDFLELDFSRLGERYRNMYWAYGQKILAALEDVAQNDLLDVVYFTNFSCGPDSFILSYASEIMRNRPFLALELDEHGSATGYLTRIEAYFDVLRRPRKETQARKVYPEDTGELKERIMWVPNMHPYTTAFFSAALRSRGFRSQPIPLETDESFEIGRSVTRGSECLPTALTIGSLLSVLRRSDPKEKHAFFMPTAEGPCRFGQYISLHKQILEREGFPDVPILAPSHFRGFEGLDETVRRTLWKAWLAGDVLMKAGCKLRPYEREAGETNYRLEQEMQRLISVIETNGDLLAGVKEAVANLSQIKIRKIAPKPLVGIVGEIYVRNNQYANENVIRSVEKLGAEAWMTPLSEWILFTSSMHNVFEHDGYRLQKKQIRSYIKWRWMLHWEKKINEAASPLLDDRHEPDFDLILNEGKKVLAENIGGEAILTIGRAVKFAHQGATMVVNVAPFSCMPGTITTAVFRQLSAELGMPIVNLFYDGTGGENRRLEVYLRTAMNSDRLELPAYKGDEAEDPTLPLPPDDARCPPSLRA